MEINNAQLKGAGLYQCIAFNLYGMTYSRKSNLTVLGKF